MKKAKENVLFIIVVLLILIAGAYFFTTRVPIKYTISKDYTGMEYTKDMDIVSDSVKLHIYGDYYDYIWNRKNSDYFRGKFEISSMPETLEYEAYFLAMNALLEPNGNKKEVHMHYVMCDDISGMVTMEKRFSKIFIELGDYYDKNILIFPAETHEQAVEVYEELESAIYKKNLFAATENITERETTTAGTYDKIMGEEQKELSWYQGIKDAAKLNAFYNLDSEEETSARSRHMAQSFPSTGNFRYFYTEDDVIFLGVVAQKDGVYYELLYNTSDGSSVVQAYDTVRTEEKEEVGSDNITRRQTLFFLEKEGTSKYIGKDVRNITVSEVVDALKQHKGNTDKAAYEVWGNLKENLERGYSPEYGLLTDLKYTTEVDGALYLCGLNLTPKGYCLTVYDPVKDWFEVWEFDNIYRITAADGTEEYYLSNLTEETEYQKNTVLDIDEDGYVYVGD